MALANLLTLIDDIASLLDDVAALTKTAGAKTAGVLGDDLALNAQQVTGVRVDRELPVVWAVFKGSLLNKTILVPLALAISAFVPWLVTPLLTLGGLFLCFEGAEKLLHSALHRKHAEHAADHAPTEPAPAASEQAPLNEKERVKGAIRTDFILSAEIIAITLGICTWLAEQFPEKNLIPPAGHVERGEFYRWMCFALHLEYAAMDRRFQLPDNDPERRFSVGYGDFDTAFNTLRQHLKTREHLVGDHTTVLDLYYAGLLMQFMQPRGTDTDNPRNRPVLSIDDPVLGPYAKRQTSRPAFARAAALDNELAARMASA